MSALDDMTREELIGDCVLDTRFRARLGACHRSCADSLALAFRSGLQQVLK